MTNTLKDLEAVAAGEITDLQKIRQILNSGRAACDRLQQEQQDIQQAVLDAEGRLLGYEMPNDRRYILVLNTRIDVAEKD